MYTLNAGRRWHGKAVEERGTVSLGPPNTVASLDVSLASDSGILIFRWGWLTGAGGRPQTVRSSSAASWGGAEVLAPEAVRVTLQCADPWTGMQETRVVAPLMLVFLITSTCPFGLSIQRSSWLRLKAKSQSYIF